MNLIFGATSIVTEVNCVLAAGPVAALTPPSTVLELMRLN